MYRYSKGHYMEHKSSLILLVVIVLSMTVIGVSSAEDHDTDTADDCYVDGYNPVSIENLMANEGDNEDTEAIHSPDDDDAWKLSSDKGDYFVFSIRAPDSVQFSVRAVGSFSFSDGTNWASGEDYAYIDDTDEPATFKIYDENRDGYLCLEFTEQGNFDEEYPYYIKAARNEEPDWYEEASQTPTPTSTLTTTSTSTPTTIPTSTQTPTVTEADSSEDSTSSPTEDNGNSGNDIQDSDADGVIDSEDYAPDDPDVQEKSDLQDASGGSVPGFGVGAAIVTLLIATFIASHRS